ncbi:MAG: MiaB/RimO family radical SAM methylthiotransferase, partial [Erysipelotrichaceae bacterium]|nr:MiaB/RimO family radical SAM methylthiotransferase [Erysipelotrichaceae bacterium]
TRGKERSRLMDDILLEVNELKEQGFKEVTLLGQNVNAYGKDLKLQNGFAALLEEVAKTGIPRIRFTTSHPWDFSDAMIDVISRYDNIMPSIHLPVQSGNSQMLRLMGRRYTKDDYLDLYNRIVNKIPNCTFTTDIIVGFPNETEEQFQDTLDMVDYCKYDGAYTFIYSPREGTPAAKMEDNVSLEDKNRRLQTLNEKVNYYAKLNNDKYLNKVVKVLVDGTSKKNDQVYSGYSEENKLVNFTAKHVEVGDIVEVLIKDCKTWSLKGEMIER